MSSKAQRRTVLLDVGGVLTTDPWESILLTPGKGLADSLRSDHEALAIAGRMMFEMCCRGGSEEAFFWEGVWRLLGEEVAPSQIELAEARCLTILADADEIVDCLRRRNSPWGLVTDSTSFWFEKQMELLRVEPKVVPWLFASHELGVCKRDKPGLYGLAREAMPVPAESVLVIDDREENVEAAALAGFTVMMKPSSGWVDLPDAIAEWV